jgi:glycosyltransferase involved in cell wall biosynthesis
MKLTIGMASYQNSDQVWFTLQSLRLYHDLTDVELLVIDNFGDNSLREKLEYWMKDVRYVCWNEVQGPANAKNQVFTEAIGDWVLLIDSHVFLEKDSIKTLKEWISNNYSNDLYHGPLVYDDFRCMADAMNDEWRGEMWGTWRNAYVEKNIEPYEIPMHGCGLMLCRKVSWQGFNRNFRGFGGEEGYIHEKFRQSGYKVILLPWLQWFHYFQNGSGKIPYTPLLEDKIRNYTIGIRELNLNPDPFLQHFGLKQLPNY